MGNCMHRRNMCSLTERLALNERMQLLLSGLFTFEAGSYREACAE